MPYGPIKFRSTVVKPYNYNFNTDDPEDIIYTKGPARPGRLEVRIPAVAAPLAAIIPTAEILSTIPIVAIYLSPATSPNQARLLSLLLVRVVSDVIINKD